MNDERDNDKKRGGDRELAASDSEIERALDELEELIPPKRNASRGQVIDGRYRVVDELGRGGFGRVIKVSHLQLGREFALKILHPEISREPDFITRFQEEARATSIIGHDNIVFVTDFGECPIHGHYLVMEYLDGQRLADVLRQSGILGLEEALGCVVAVGSALAAVHQLGIVHCDLKPANIMQASRAGGTHIWKVLDFGTASIVSNSVQSESVFGTPRYMAPEHAEGKEVDARTDIFSLGVVVYEMLSGRLPWEVSGWAQARSGHRFAHPPPPLQQLVGRMPRAASEAVMKAIEVDRNDRWANIEDFVGAFRDGLDVAYIPVSDSLDAISENLSFKRSKTAPVVSEVHRAASLVVEQPTDLGHGWRMVFSTADRLRREYHRNMVARGLFVTTDSHLPPHDDEARVTVVFSPEDDELDLVGRVVSHSRGNPSGFGLELSSEAQESLERFLDANGIRRSLANGARLRAADQIPARSWTPAEAFVLSIASREVSLVELRARSAGLPFDVEKAVFGLQDAGLLEIVDAAVSKRHSFTRRQPSSPEFKIVFDKDEVDQVLELAQQFHERGNFLASRDVLERACEVASDPAPFKDALSKLEAVFRAAPSTSSEQAPGARKGVMSRSFQLQKERDSEDDTRGRLQRLLGTDPLDD